MTYCTATLPRLAQFINPGILRFPINIRPVRHFSHSFQLNTHTFALFQILSTQLSLLSEMLFTRLIRRSHLTIKILPLLTLFTRFHLSRFTPFLTQRFDFFRALLWLHGIIIFQSLCGFNQMFTRLIRPPAPPVFKFHYHWRSSTQALIQHNTIFSRQLHVFQLGTDLAMDIDRLTILLLLQISFHLIQTSQHSLYLLLTFFSFTNQTCIQTIHRLMKTPFQFSNSFTHQLWSTNLNPLSLQISQAFAL